MRKLLKYIFIIMLIILIKLLLGFTINEIIISNYNNNVYNNSLIKTIYLFNFNEPYIVYYNNGNILYKKEDYDEAIENYNKSLGKNPPQSKVCDIRINLSLAIIKKINNTDSTIAYEQLELARKNLYKNNCADPNGDSGNSKDAESLEEEIKGLEEKLKAGSDDDKPSNDDPEENEEPNKDEYSDIEEQIKENEQNSNAGRQGDLDNYENLDDYEYYPGKRW